MTYNNIEEGLESLPSVNEVYTVFNQCKSKNVDFFIVALNIDEYSVYDFINELNNLARTEDYIVITNIPGFDDPKFVGVVDGVKDMFSWAVENCDVQNFGALITAVNRYVTHIKDENPFISYKNWILLKPSIDEILQYA